MSHPTPEAHLERINKIVKYSNRSGMCPANRPAIFRRTGPNQSTECLGCPACAQQFHRRCTGPTAPFNRRYEGPTTVTVMMTDRRFTCSSFIQRFVASCVRASTACRGSEHC
ncbi:unnamed protein product, partial [Ectocarpus sp. 13 AM-2016]